MKEKGKPCGGGGIGAGLGQFLLVRSMTATESSARGLEGGGRWVSHYAHSNGLVALGRDCSGLPRSWKLGFQRTRYQLILRAARSGKNKQLRPGHRLKTGARRNGNKIYRTGTVWRVRRYLDKIESQLRSTFIGQGRDRTRGETAH